MASPWASTRYSARSLRNFFRGVACRCGKPRQRHRGISQSQVGSMHPSREPPFVRSSSPQASPKGHPFEPFRSPPSTLRPFDPSPSPWTLKPPLRRGGMDRSPASQLSTQTDVNFDIGHALDSQGGARMTRNAELPRHTDWCRWVRSHVPGFGRGDSGPVRGPPFIL